MRVHGFFPALAATTVDGRLQLDEAAFADITVTELPGTVRVAVVVVWSGAASSVDLGIACRRPDGSRGEVHRLTVLNPGRYVHDDVLLDLFEEGEHELLLEAAPAVAEPLAAYPVGVRLAPGP